MFKMLSAKQPGVPVFMEEDEQIVMANPVLLFWLDRRCILLRILAIHGAKIIPPGTFCLILLQPDCLLRRKPQEEALVAIAFNRAKHVRGVEFLVILTPCIASIVKWPLVENIMET